MDVRPIKTDADYRAALAEIETLMSAARDTPEGDRLDVLATLVEAYEKKHFPIDPPDPIAAIRFRMEQDGLTRAALEPAIGSRARVAEILNRKRALTLVMIRNLATRLRIPAEALIAEYDLVGTGAKGKRAHPSRTKRASRHGRTPAPSRRRSA